jgi:general secretion pathway protein D
MKYMRGHYKSWIMISGLGWMRERLKIMLVVSVVLVFMFLSAAAQAKDKGISLNFKDTPLETVLHYLSEEADLVVVSDYDLTDRITVISRSPLNLDEAISLINTILKERNYAAVRTGRTLKIVPFEEAKKMNVPVRSGTDPNAIIPGDELVTHIIPIRYADAVKLKDNLSTLISPDADFTANEETNTLIITDTTANIRRLVEIVNEVDTHTASVDAIRVFHLEYADATDTAKLINDIFEEDGQTSTAAGQQMTRIFAQMMPGGRGGPPGSGAGGRTTGNGGARVSLNVNASSDERTNSVVVSAPVDVMGVIEDLVRDLDANPSETQGVFVYHLKNARAENLMEVLNSLFNELEGTETQNTGAANQRQGQQAGTARQMGPQMWAQTTSSDTSSVDDLAGQVYIEADEDTNSLIVMTSPKNYKKVKEILAELDEPVPQVLIKVLLAEVTHDDSIDLGMEFSYVNIWEEEGFVKESTDFSTNFGLASETTGLIGIEVDGHFDGTLRALEEDGKLNILSRPYILASNNQEAKITVGNEVPFIRDSRVTETGQTINTIEYEDIGIILEVTPYINPEGLVIMDIAQEISAITGTSVPISETVNASVFSKRSSENRVTVRDGQTVVIGGLMEDRITDSVSKVPLLGDIPLLGYLFKRKKKESQKTELLIFLTPYVATKDEELKAITENEKKESNMIKDSFQEGAFKDLSDDVKEQWIEPSGP